MNANIHPPSTRHSKIALLGSVLLVGGALALSAVRARTPRQKLRVALHHVERRLAHEERVKLTQDERDLLLQGPTDLDPALRKRWLRVVGATIMQPWLDLEQVRLREFLDGRRSEREGYAEAFDRLRAVLLLSVPREAEEPGLTERQREWLLGRISSNGHTEDASFDVRPAIQRYLEHAHRDAAWLWPRDEDLVHDARHRLGTGIEDVDLWLIDRLERDQGLPDLTLEAIVGEVGALQSDRGVRGLYTRDAWEFVVRDALSDLGDAPSPEAWVLAAIDDRSAVERRSSLRYFYFGRYWSEWSSLLQRVYSEPPLMFDQSYLIAERLVMNRLLPLQRFVGAVDYHTRLVDVDPFELGYYEDLDPFERGDWSTFIRETFAAFVEFGIPPEDRAPPFVQPLEAYHHAMVELQQALLPFLLFGGNEEWHVANDAMTAFKEDVDNLTNWNVPRWASAWGRLLQGPIVEGASCRGIHVPRPAG